MGRKKNIEKSEAEAEAYKPMDFDEITRRIRNGADIQTLADLHGWGYTKMVQRLQYMEKKYGRQLLTPDIMRPSHRKMYLAMKAAAEKREKEPEGKLEDLAPKIEPEPEPARIPEEVYTAKDFESLPTIEREIMPVTIDQLNDLYIECKILADRYTKQAEDYRRILKYCGVSFPEGNT